MIDFKNFLNNKKTNIFIILAIVGLLLIFFSEIFSTTGNKPQEKSENSNSEYLLNLEKDLKETISSISGAGKTDVMITLECGVENIYATTDKISSDKNQSSKSDSYSTGEKSTGEQEYIIIKNGDKQEALLITQIAPKIKGVVIVCEGGDDQDVIKRITLAASTSLGITESKICVVPKK